MNCLTTAPSKVGTKTPAPPSVAGKVIFVSESAEADEHLLHAVSELKRSGRHVTFLIGKRGPLSAWLSKNHVYYFICDLQLPGLYDSPSTRFKKVNKQIYDLAQMLANSKIHHIYTVGDSALASQVRGAARLAGNIPCTLFGSMPGLAGVAPANSGGELTTARDARSKPSNSYLRLASYIMSVSICKDSLLRSAYMPIKRNVDICISLTLALMTAPLWLAVMAFRLTKGVTPYDRVTIEGKNNKQLTLLSFVPDAELADNCANSRWKSVWWLPGLFSVLDGTLSIVGPRIVPTMKATPVDQGGIYLELQPGLTGWAQLKARNGFSEAELVAMDQAYMLSVNPILDLKILVATLLRLGR